MDWRDKGPYSQRMADAESASARHEAQVARERAQSAVIAAQAARYAALPEATRQAHRFLAAARPLCSCGWQKETGTKDDWYDHVFSL